MKDEYDFSNGARGRFYRPNARIYLPLHSTGDTMQITKESHVHDLTNDQLGYIADLLAARSGFFIERIDIPEALGKVPCALYGPIMGDGPIADADVHFGKRGDRTYDSRLIHQPTRPMAYVTVIAGPHEGKPCILYTVFGGPLSPKEPSDPTLEASKLGEFRERQVMLLQIEDPTPEQKLERVELAKKISTIEGSKEFWKDHALACGEALDIKL